MFSSIWDWLRSFVDRQPIRLAVVRRYCDANGSYVGELYMAQEQNGVSSYRMIGASLDTFPLNATRLLENEPAYAIDTANDFLAPMMACRIRVGAIDPQDNDKVRQMVRRMPKYHMSFIIQNRFVEHVLERETQP